MSYNINVSGHKDVETQEEGKAFEEEIAAKAKDFVASLEGVTSAYGSFGSLGSIDLQEKAEE
jgi:hypothetical protein